MKKEYGEPTHQTPLQYLTNSTKHAKATSHQPVIIKCVQLNVVTILKRTFVNRLGYGTLKRIADQDVKYANALNYLINDIEALRYFVYGGKINMHGSYLQSFKAFADIYEKYEADMSNGSDDNFNLRLAISIALSHSRKETTSAWRHDQHQ